jgi:hypothetical protein
MFFLASSPITVFQSSAFKGFQRRLPAFIFYLFYLCFISLSLAYRASAQNSSFSAWLSPENILSLDLKFGDPRYFIMGAFDIVKTGWFTSDTRWIGNLWPPGFILLEAVIIKIFGPNVSLPLALQVISCILYSVVLVLVKEVLAQKRLNVVLQYFLPMLLFVPEFARSFFLGPLGVLFGEFLSVAFFAIGVLLICLSQAWAPRGRLIILGSAFIGLSSYFRSHYEVIVHFFIFQTLIVLAALCAFTPRKSLREWYVYCRPWFLGVLVCLVIMLPWRVYRIMSEGTPAWVSTSELVYANSTASSKSLIAKGGGWLVDGGANMTCRLSSVNCDVLFTPVKAKALFYKTFSDSWIPWIAIKANLLPAYIFRSYSDLYLLSPRARSPDFKTLVSRGLFIVLLLGFSFISIASRIHGARSPSVGAWIESTSLFFAAGTLATSAIFGIFAHLEVRYFFFPLFMVVLCSILLFPAMKTSAACTPSRALAPDRRKL